MNYEYFKWYTSKKLRIIFIINYYQWCAQMFLTGDKLYFF